MSKFYQIKYREEFEDEKGKTKWSKGRLYLIEALSTTEAEVRFVKFYQKYGTTFEVVDVISKPNIEGVLLDSNP